jgi:hypothetical protein
MRGASASGCSQYGTVNEVAYAAQRGDEDIEREEGDCIYSLIKEANDKL